MSGNQSEVYARKAPLDDLTKAPATRDGTVPIHRSKRGCCHRISLKTFLLLNDENRYSNDFRRLVVTNIGDAMNKYPAFLMNGISMPRIIGVDLLPEVILFLRHWASISQQSCSLVVNDVLRIGFCFSN